MIDQLNSGIVLVMVDRGTMSRGRRIIHMAGPEDAASVRAIYDQTVTHAAASFEYVSPTVAEMAGRIASTCEELPWLIFQQGDIVAGYAYAVRHRTRQAYQWSVETSVYVDAGHQGLGVGRALYDSLLAILKLQGYVTALAGIALPNPASEALHRACGFQPIGVFRAVGYKLGRWHDVAWWQCRLGNLAEEPAGPNPIHAIRHLEAFRVALETGVNGAG